MTLFKKMSSLMIFITVLAGVIIGVMLMSCDLNGLDGNGGSGGTEGTGGTGNTGGDESVQSGNSVADPTRKKFWVLDRYDKYFSITASKRAVGDKCEVWVDENESVPEEKIAEIVTKFDTNIYGTLRNVFDDYLTLGRDVGKNLDVDANGRLLLLFTNIKDDYTSEGDVFVAGYFSWIDLFTVYSSYSNGADMIVVDTYPTLSKPPDTMYTTIAHEYQHLNNFASMVYYRAKVEGGKLILPLVDTWIDEGIASIAEHLYQNQNQKKLDDSLIRWFNQDTKGTIAQGNNFYVWGEKPASIMDEYATVYLFFQWLRLQSRGFEIYKDIVNSPLYSDYRGVTAAAGTKIDSKYNDWAALLGDWFETNYRNEPSGRYGYKGEITTRVWAIKRGSYDLYPGEGVYGYGQSSGAAPADSGYLKYKKITKGLLLSDLYKPYSGDRILMYNANTERDSTLTGTLPGSDADESKPSFTVSSVLLRSVDGNGSESHAIDIRDLIGRQNGGGVITLKRPEADNGQD